MAKRGRKSAAELAVMPYVRPVSAYDPKPPQHELPPPPDHLSEGTRLWWRALVADYKLDPHHLRVLQVAAEAWDRKEQARQALVEHGLSYTDDKGMIRARPEVQIERDARTAFLRALRELNLDVEPPKPPRYGGIGITWEQLQDDRRKS
jgi:phage terminase small subunit